jgi:hypothetical protein
LKKNPLHQDRAFVTDTNKGRPADKAGRLGQ